MKKAILLALILSSYRHFCQNAAYSQSSKLVTIGYGAPNSYKSLLKTNAEKDRTNFAGFKTVDYDISGSGVYVLKYDHAITKALSLGAVLGYYNAGIRMVYTYDQVIYNYTTPVIIKSTDVFRLDVKSISAGARINWHYINTEKFESYLGFALGYTHNIVSESFASNNPYAGKITASVNMPLYVGFTAGFRYYFTKNLGLYTEVGWDKQSLLQAGFAIKFE